MKNVKQVIVIRKDLKMRKERLANISSQATIKFLLENNESDRHDELFVKLSKEEVQWMDEHFPQSIVGVDSQDALSDISFRAQLLGINVYSVVESKNIKSKENFITSCIVLGPDDEDILNKITGNLKTI